MYHVSYTPIECSIHSLWYRYWKFEEKFNISARLNFKVFGYRVKHPFEGLIKLLKLLIILGENQSKSSPNFMIIKITYPNLHHGCNFPCFLSMNYWVWERYGAMVTFFAQKWAVRSISLTDDSTLFQGLFVRSFHMKNFPKFHKL